MSLESEVELLPSKSNKRIEEKMSDAVWFSHPTGSDSAVKRKPIELKTSLLQYLDPETTTFHKIKSVRG